MILRCPSQTLHHRAGTTPTVRRYWLQQQFAHGQQLRSGVWDRFLLAESCNARELGGGHRHLRILDTTFNPQANRDELR
jgi:hypothetical protein